MLITETLRIALLSIRSNLFRAALTMLGIIIGVGAVITMVALGTGAQRAIDEQMAAFRELEIMADLSHANLLSTFAYFEKGDSQLGFVLELMGMDLKQACARPLRLGALFKCAKQV